MNLVRSSVDKQSKEAQRNLPAQEGGPGTLQHGSGMQLVRERLGAQRD